MRLRQYYSYLVQLIEIIYIAFEKKQYFTHAKWEEVSWIFTTETYDRQLAGMRLLRLESFLRAQDIEYDDGIEYGVLMYDEHGDIAAAGGAQGNVLKSIATHEKYRGEGLLGSVMSSLSSQAFLRGNTHLFLFTKPKNLILFEPFGFFCVASTDKMSLMENRAEGIKNFVKTLKNPMPTTKSSTIVANCNPFTLGHLHLIEHAAGMSELLHLFILSEKKSFFPPQVRLNLVRQGVAHLKNVVVHPTSDYIVSSATFPTYFLKDSADVENISCELDLKIFCDYFVPPLNIVRRFVGEEPFCAVTAKYNEQMMEYLPRHGVEVVKIPRKIVDGVEISASHVRELLMSGDWEKIRNIVPKTTFDYLISPECAKLIEKGKSTCQE